MIWECAERRRERRRIAKYDWHIRFAWLPVRLEDGRTLWLQSYSRRWQDFRHHPGGSWQRAEPGTCGAPRLPFMDRLPDPVASLASTTPPPAKK